MLPHCRFAVAGIVVAAGLGTSENVSPISSDRFGAAVTDRVSYVPGDVLREEPRAEASILKGWRRSA
jgi:hypothetical protein